MGRAGGGRGGRGGGRRRGGRPRARVDSKGTAGILDNRPCDARPGEGRETWRGSSTGRRAARVRAPVCVCGVARAGEGFVQDTCMRRRQAQLSKSLARWLGRAGLLGGRWQWAWPRARTTIVCGGVRVCGCVCV